MNNVRTVIANNASPMTLDGTRTYIIGQERVAIIDPGPHLDEHFDAVANQVGSGVVVSILLTHDHPDHGEGAWGLGSRLAAEMVAVADGLVVETDAGEINAIHTPGHTPDHFAFHLAGERAVFCGDLMMGGLETALVARPEGDLQQYLQSLEKLRALQPAIIYPAHGPAFEDPEAAIDRYVHHRMERVQQVFDALQNGSRDVSELLSTIYGSDLDPQLRSYAGSAIEAYLHYLLAEGRVQHTNMKWSRA